MTLGALTAIILTTLENISSTGLTYNHHLWSSQYYYNTGHRPDYEIFKDVILISQCVYCHALLSKCGGLYYKLITIVNDDSGVVRMMLQVVASTMIIILMTLEALTTIIPTTIENIYSIGLTYNQHLVASQYCYSTGHRPDNEIFTDIILIS